MKHIRNPHAAQAALRTHARQRLRMVTAWLLLTVCMASGVWAGNLRVMKTGIGDGSITVAEASITDCNNTCSGTFTDDSPLTFTANEPTGHKFLRWEGSVNSTDNPATVTLSGDHRVRAVFVVLKPMTMNPYPVIRDFTPEGLRRYFTDNPGVNTPARFISVLPPAFRQNWILMTRSESLQTGTAFSPRILLPDSTGKFVFTIGLTEHRSYPGSHPMAVEYMQWDEDQKNFRFHEVILGDIRAMQTHAGVTTYPIRNRAAIDFISIDDKKCSRCHSTRNVLNNTGMIGTTGSPPGLVQAKSKPNWDTYDSWAGMLAFNRDRIYQGTVEAAAFRFLFYPWNWEAQPAFREVMEQLELQPADIDARDLITRIVGGPNDGRIVFAFDPLAERPVLREPLIEGVPTITTAYEFDGQRGSGTTTTISRGRPSVTLRHSTLLTGVDEGRGVRLFDLLGGANRDALGNLNAQRVADELVNHQFITGSRSFDVRPIALAIARRYLRIDTVRDVVVDSVDGVDIVPRADFFAPRHGVDDVGRPLYTITSIFRDTRTRAYNLPRRKADLQFINLSRQDDPYLYNLRMPSMANPPAPARGLLPQYAASTSYPMGSRFDSTRREVFRRPSPGEGRNDRTIMGGIYVDREDSVPGYPFVDPDPRPPRVAFVDNAHVMALFRYYLEPLGVSVDKWNMGVRGRSRTYTFADVLTSFYPVLDRVLANSLRTRPVYSADLARNLDPANPADVIRAINITFGALPPPTDVPTFVDVQRVFNKSCIECHGGLEYPPYSNYNNGRAGPIDFSEDERMGMPRLDRSHTVATSYEFAIMRFVRRTSEALEYATGMMPWGGPSISQCDVETLRRWYAGGGLLSTGDPHLVTIDGTSYDFQAAGEYVLLRGEFFELQARHKAIHSAGPLGPNGHTGLSTCVSVNTGVAMRIGGRRVTYLPPLGNEQDGSKLELRLDGQLTALPAEGLAIAPGIRIVRDGSPHGIRIEGRSGTTISIAAAFWDGYQTWIMDIQGQRLHGREGLMGNLQTDSWLPALPDGSSVGPMPEELNARYKVLYGVFGPAWAVTDSTTLFDYAPGSSTASYRLPTWPQGESPNICEVPASPVKPSAITGMDRAAAEKACNEVGDQRLREFCIQDLMATGATVFVENYKATDRVYRNRPPAEPKLSFPANGARDVRLPIDFRWEATTDPDSEAVTYRHLVWPVHEMPDTNLAAAVGSDPGGARRCGLIALLIGVGIWLLLFLLLRKRLPKLVWLLLFLVVILAAWLAYYLCGRSSSAPTHREVAQLETGMAYNWKIIAEDGKGGVTESETFRFEVP